MVRDTEERERPGEWLRKWREGARGYAELLKESGVLVVAAYRLARARCMAGVLATGVPTLREVHAAASELAQAAGFASPSLASLAFECDEEGLLVIGCART